MKVVLIIIGIIFYISIGAVIAAVEESERYDKTQEYGLNFLICIFWPIYILYKVIKNFINKFRKEN